jgi:hypothetical protein
MKHILYVLFFLLGAAGGVYWGVHHPVAAANVAADEQRQALIIKQKVAEAKVELLQKFQGPDKVDVQPMIQAEQKNADDAKAQLGTNQ